VTRSPGFFLFMRSTIARSCTVAGSLPMDAIAFGPQVLNSVGTWSSPKHLMMYAVFRVCPLLRMPRSSSLPRTNVSASSMINVG
jgi:hypothetical protein